MIVLAGHLPLEEAILLFAKAEQRVRGGEQLPSTQAVLSLVATTRCSAYDAEYVSLAQTLGVPLVTSDTRLIRLFPGVATTPGAFGGG